MPNGTTAAIISQVPTLIAIRLFDESLRAGRRRKRKVRKKKVKKKRRKR